MHGKVCVSLANHHKKRQLHYIVIASIVIASIVTIVVIGGAVFDNFFSMKVIFVVTVVVAVMMIRAVAFRQVAFRAVPLARLSTNLHAGVENISVKKFGEIISGPDRQKYQIVDVREANELAVSSIKGSDIIHMPLSKLEEWGGKVISGKLLDPTKPTICLCKKGIRGMKVATYLGN